MTTLLEYVGADAQDTTFVEACYEEAQELVDSFVGEATVPVSVLGRAYLECGSELYHRRSAPNGVAQFTTLDGSAIRIARDPLVGVYPILRRYVGFGAA